MTSEDYMEAFDRLLQLNLQSVQEREIIRIILICAARVAIRCFYDSQEKQFNPYYGYLLNQLCKSKPSHKFTLQLAFQDVFKTIQDYTNGKLMNQVIEKYYHVEDGGPIAKDCTERVHADLEKEVPEKPGIHEILKWLKENNFRIAVASSSPRPLIERNLKMTDTFQYIDVCCSGTEVKHGKPAPDLFLHAAEKIGLPAEECYIFEDAYNGIRAAYAAGGKPIMVPDTQEPDDEMKEKAHAICTTLLDALDVLKKETV